MFECAICCEERIVVAVGLCGHAQVCLECSFKMRARGGDQGCPVCKQQLAEVLVVAAPVPAQPPTGPRTHFQHGIFFCDDVGRRECERLIALHCPVPKCRRDALPNSNALQKHLRDQHRRFFCELCLDNRTLLVSQQRIFRSEELQRHLEHGDFDEEHNLIFRHPLCAFCNRRFFDEEAFLDHMRKAHFKCDLCRGEAQRHTYYHRYPNLQQHFSMSHYACPNPDCVAKGHVAFETREQLEKHVAIHSEQRAPRRENLFQRLSPPVPTAPINDREGVDVSKQLLSLCKAEPVGGEPPSATAAIDYLDVLDLLVADRPRSAEEDRELLQLQREASTAGGYAPKNGERPRVFFEEAKFVRNEFQAGLSFTELQAQLGALLTPEEEDELWGASARFFREKISAAQLFDLFARVFGPRLCFKYFHAYQCTVKSARRREECAAELQRRLAALPFRHRNLLVGAETWKGLFARLAEEIAANIRRRLEAKTLLPDRGYRFNKLRLFQLMQSVKSLSLRDIIRFKFLANFLQEIGGRAHLARAMLGPMEAVQKTLDRVANTDILVMFLYFNIVELLFEERLRVAADAAYNPNLLRLYFRHYPDQAARFQYSLLSEAEDYEETPAPPSKAPSRESERRGWAWPTEEARAPAPEPKVAVFASQPAAAVFRNDFDFPSLVANRAPAAPPATAKRSGWGSDVTVLYTNEVGRRKAYDEEFPDLGSESQPAPSAPPPVSLQPTAGRRPNAPTAGRDLLRDVQSGGVVVPIVTLKKKKKP